MVEKSVKRSPDTKGCVPLQINLRRPASAPRSRCKNNLPRHVFSSKAEHLNPKKLQTVFGWNKYRNAVYPKHAMLRPSMLHCEK